MSKPSLETPVLTCASRARITANQASSNTGPGKSQLQYSTDGIRFTSLGGVNTVRADASPNPVWSSTTYNSIYTFLYDLSSVADLNNAANVYFWLVETSTTSANGGTVGGAGSVGLGFRRLVRQRG
jgi:hypothetical protein